MATIVVDGKREELHNQAYAKFLQSVDLYKLRTCAECHAQFYFTEKDFENVHGTYTDYKDAWWFTTRVYCPSCNNFIHEVREFVSLTPVIPTENTDSSSIIGRIILFILAAILVAVNMLIVMYV